MKKIVIIILLSISYFLHSCGNGAKKQPKKEIIGSVNKLKPVGERKFKVSSFENSALKNIDTNSTYYQKNNYSLNSKTTDTTQSDNLRNTEYIDINLKQSNKSLLTFTNLKKILSNSEIGETFTQQELSQNFEIPKEAVKIVKSITKTAEDEIAVKWKSKWFIEKLSDAKFTDAKMKIKFESNKMFISGKAIAIKHNKKLYTDLIIIGNSAYIPSVKGYHWKIGK